MNTRTVRRALIVTILGTIAISTVGIAGASDGDSLRIISPESLTLEVDDSGSASGVLVVATDSAPRTVAGRFIAADGTESAVALDGDESVMLRSVVEVLEVEVSGFGDATSGQVVLVAEDGAIAVVAASLSTGTKAKADDLKAISVLSDALKVELGKEGDPVVLVVLNPNDSPVSIAARGQLDDGIKLPDLGTHEAASGESYFLLDFSAITVDEPSAGDIILEWGDGEGYVTHELTITNRLDVVEFGRRTVGVGLIAAVLYLIIAMVTTDDPTTRLIAPGEKTGTFEGWAKRTAALVGGTGILGTVLSKDLFGDTIGGVEKGAFIAVQVVFLVLLILDDFVFSALERPAESFVEKPADLNASAKSLVVRYFDPRLGKWAPVIDASSGQKKPAELKLTRTRKIFTGQAATVSGFILATSLTVWAIFGELATLFVVFTSGTDNRAVLSFSAALAVLATVTLVAHLNHGLAENRSRSVTVAEGRTKMRKALNLELEAEAKELRTQAYKDAMKGPGPPGPGGLSFDRLLVLGDPADLDASAEVEDIFIALGIPGPDPGTTVSILEPAVRP